MCSGRPDSVPGQSMSLRLGKDGLLSIGSPSNNPGPTSPNGTIAWSHLLFTHKHGKYQQALRNGFTNMSYKRFYLLTHTHTHTLTIVSVSKEVSMM